MVEAIASADADAVGGADLEAVAEVSAVDAEAAEAEAADASAEEEAPLFADTAIDWSWIHTMQVDLTTSAQTLLVQSAPFTDVELGLSIKDGVARVSPFQGRFGEGGFDGDLRLAVNEQGMADIEMSYSTQGISIEDFGLMPAQELSGGELDGGLQLTTSGSSPAQLAAGLNGEFNLNIGAMMLASGLVDLAGSDLLMEALNRLNPFRQEDPQTEFQCGALHFEAVDGVIENDGTLVIETSKMRIEGDAKVDLTSEDLDLTFSPRAKGGFGVGVGNLVKFVKLGGKLRDPAMEVDALGLVQSGAALGAVLSTGGVSLLAEGLAKRVLSDSGCAQEAVEIVVEEEAGADAEGGAVEVIDSENG